LLTARLRTPKRIAAASGDDDERADSAGRVEARRALHDVEHTGPQEGLDEADSGDGDEQVGAEGSVAQSMSSEKNQVTSLLKARLSTPKRIAAASGDDDERADIEGRVEVSRLPEKKRIKCVVRADHHRTRPANPVMNTEELLDDFRALHGMSASCPGSGVFGNDILLPALPPKSVLEFFGIWSLKSHTKIQCTRCVGLDAFNYWKPSVLTDLGLSSDTDLFGWQSDLPRDQLVGVCASFGHSTLFPGHLVDCRYEWAYGDNALKGQAYRHGIHCLHTFEFEQGWERSSLEGFSRQGRKYNTRNRPMIMDSKTDVENMLDCAGCAYIRTQLLPCACASRANCPHIRAVPCRFIDFISFMSKQYDFKTGTVLPMKALPVYQPWASLLAKGCKLTELCTAQTAMRVALELPELWHERILSGLL
jgi:hypothetical protein